MYAYLSSSAVREFRLWMEPRLSEPGSFLHQYFTQKTKGHWHCNSLYDAYRRYSWGFGFDHPTSGVRVRGRTLKDNLNALSALRKHLRSSIGSRDQELCSASCKAILQWGGVAGQNAGAIRNLGDDVVSYLANARRQIRLAAQGQTIPELRMNSGFSKIYALLCDDFIIYDSRVAAALGLLVRRFCEEASCHSVPHELAFGQPVHRSTARRDPGCRQYRFPRLYTSRQYVYSNLHASWLIQHMVKETESAFSEIEECAGAFALQSALFMIGYDIGDIQPVSVPTRTDYAMYSGKGGRSDPRLLPAADAVVPEDDTLPRELRFQILSRLPRLPLNERGIRITEELALAAVTMLNYAPNATLPQNCRNAARDRTPDGLDRRIKERLNTDLRTANIVSDVLAEAGIVEIVRLVNEGTGRYIKGTRLLERWRW